MWMGGFVPALIEISCNIGLFRGKPGERFLYPGKGNGEEDHPKRPSVRGWVGRENLHPKIRIVRRLDAPMVFFTACFADPNQHRTEGIDFKIAVSSTDFRTRREEKLHTGIFINRSIPEVGFVA